MLDRTSDKKANNRDENVRSQRLHIDASRNYLGSLDVKFQLGKEWFPRLRSSFMAGAKRIQVIESAKLQSGTILAAMELDPN